jgi:hypothetical protein
MTPLLNLRWGLAVLIAIGFQCFLVNAQEQQGISGMGAQRCAILAARLTARTNPNDTTEVLTWIQGFISGLNMNAENDFYYDLTNVTSEQQTAQILTYCRNRPSEAVINAALNLAQSFLARKPTHPRWQEAFEAGQAPRVVLRATHNSALADCSIAGLKRHAVELA